MKQQLRILLRHIGLYVRRRFWLKKIVMVLLGALPNFQQRIVRAALRGQDEEIEAFDAAKIIMFPTTSRPRYIYIDVSGVVRQDLRTGIQRVVRGLTLALIKNPIQGYSIKPVFALANRAGYCHSDDYSSSLVKTPKSKETNKTKPPIEPQLGDIFLGLDFQVRATLNQKPYLDILHQQGLKIYFIVYDLIPIKHPKWFQNLSAKWHEEWLKAVVQYDGLICISKSVLHDLDSWLTNNHKNSNMLAINWFHLGADVKNSAPTKGFPDDHKNTIRKITSRKSFIMVGTLEPRKAHAQVLDAFEYLWQSGVDVNLVIIGKKGWKVDALSKRLSKHFEINKHLFWLEGISDEYLEEIYAASSCLIAASYEEGFGLPLIEAAQHNLPIIARDIPVFREVADKYAYFFQAQEPKNLAQAIQKWLKINEKNQHPKSENMPWLTWKESAAQLLHAFENHKHPRQ